MAATKEIAVAYKKEDLFLAQMTLYISYTLAVTLLIFILGEADLFVMCFRGKLIRQEHVHFIYFFSEGFHASTWEVEVGRSEVQDYL